MTLHVPDEVVLTNEALLTLLTGENILSGVDLHVDIEPGFGG